MKKILLTISFSILYCLSAFADGESLIALNLLEQQGVYNSDSEILGFLHTLEGDSITFNITGITDIDLFTKETPDTIWIKKRPKKNPQMGKHYNLSFIYQGTHNANGKYLTPVSAINGKKFGVLSVNIIGSDSYYSYHKKIFIKLIDLDDLSIVNFSIPYNYGFSFNISSNKFYRYLRSIIGKEFYVKTGGYSTPKYTLATLCDGEQTILFNKNRGAFTVRSEVKLNFKDKDGNDVPFNEKQFFSTTKPQELILSKAELDEKHTIRTINSEIKPDILKSQNKLPFDFRYIIGECNSHSAMSQIIDPMKVSTSSWTSNYKTIPSNALLFVGGSISITGVKFLKMILNGKAFFMKADDVTLTQDNKLKLDSLENCSPEIQEQFWNKTLFLCQSLYYNSVDETIKEFESYSKYGIAIESLRVYDESEYTKGTGVRLTVLNPTEQTIKYLSFTFQGYNAVDDSYDTPITKKCIGPIEPKETATYEFKYVWFTDAIKYAKIRSITVTYKNGQTKTNSNPKALMLSDRILETLFTKNPVEDFN